MKMYEYEKGQALDRMILFIVELFANFKRSGKFYIKPSSGRLNMWC